MSSRTGATDGTSPPPSPWRCVRRARRAASTRANAAARPPPSRGVTHAIPPAGSRPTSVLLRRRRTRLDIDAATRAAARPISPHRPSSSRSSAHTAAATAALIDQVLQLLRQPVRGHPQRPDFSAAAARRPPGRPRSRPPRSAAHADTVRGHTSSAAFPPPRQCSNPAPGEQPRSASPPRLQLRHPVNAHDRCNGCNRHRAASSAHS